MPNAVSTGSRTFSRPSCLCGMTVDRFRRIMLATHFKKSWKRITFHRFDFTICDTVVLVFCYPVVLPSRTSKNGWDTPILRWRQTFMDISICNAKTTSLRVCCTQFVKVLDKTDFLGFLKKQKNREPLRLHGFLMVRVTGVEPAASWTPFKRATKLRHTRTIFYSFIIILYVNFYN